MFIAHLCGKTGTHGLGVCVCGERERGGWARLRSPPLSMTRQEVGVGMGIRLAWCSNLSGIPATSRRAISPGWRLSGARVASRPVVLTLGVGGHGKRHVAALWHVHYNCREQTGTALRGCVEGGGGLLQSFLGLLHQVFNRLPEI